MPASGKKTASRGIPIGPLVKDVLAVAYQARMPVLLEGPTGIGKSEIVRQVADDLGIGCMVLDLSLLEPPDLVGLPRVENGRTVYAVPNSLPVAGEGILFLEELNRAERYVQQPALQLLSARMLHEYELPEGWSTCAAINPEDDEYHVTPLDPALRARFLNLQVRADRRTWLKWAGDQHIHPAILHLARSDSHFLDDVTPRSWTNLSKVLTSMQPKQVRDQRLLKALLGGFLPKAWAQNLLAAINNSGATSSADIYRLLAHYNTDCELQKMVADAASAGRTDELEQIAYQILHVIDGPELNGLITRKAFSLEAFEQFLGDIPGDFAETLHETLSGKPVVRELIGAKPADLLSPNFEGGPTYKMMKAWAERPAQRYRLSLLAKEVVRHLTNDADVDAIRKGNRKRRHLGLLLQLVEGKAQDELRQTLDTLSIDPQ